MPAVWLAAASVIILLGVLLLNGDRNETSPGFTTGPDETAMLRRRDTQEQGLLRQADEPNEAQPSHAERHVMMDDSFAGEGDTPGPGPDTITRDRPDAGDAGDSVESQSRLVSVPEESGASRGSGSPVTGTYYMDFDGPEAGVYILDLAEALKGDSQITQITAHDLVLKAPLDPAHLIITRPPGMQGLSSVDVQLEKVGGAGPRWLWPDLRLPSGDGPFKVSIPPEVLQDGIYLISFKAAGDAGAAEDMRMGFHLHVTSRDD
jgi:hypothetical protein